MTYTMLGENSINNIFPDLFSIIERDVTGSIDEFEETAAYQNDKEMCLELEKAIIMAREIITTQDNELIDGKLVQATKSIVEECDRWRDYLKRCEDKSMTLPFIREPKDLEVGIIQCREIFANREDKSPGNAIAPENNEIAESFEVHDKKMRNFRDSHLNTCGVERLLREHFTSSITKRQMTLPF